VGPAGSASYASGVFTVKGAGNSLGTTTDAFILSIRRCQVTERLLRVLLPRVPLPLRQLQSAKH